MIQMRTRGVKMSETARELGLTVGGGYEMLSRVYKKSGTRNPAGLTRWAIANGMDKPEEQLPDTGPCGRLKVIELGLSTRQLRLVQLRTQGFTRAEAARELGFTSEVSHTFSRIYNKIGVNGVAQLTRWAIANGIDELLKTTSDPASGGVSAAATGFSTRQLRLIHLRTHGVKLAEAAREIGASSGQTYKMLVRICTKVGANGLALLTRWAVGQGIDELFEPRPATILALSQAIESKLSVKERRLIQLRTRGISIGEAAEDLGITEHAGHCLMWRIHRKLGINDLALLTRWAIGNGLDESSESEDLTGTTAWHTGKTLVSRPLIRQSQDF